jgi:septal ring factor EnvC (AmiA/AmiB activator)
MKYQRRTDDDRIAELNAKIESIRARAARKAARADPVQQQAAIAMRAIEKALRDKPEQSPLVTALVIARDAIREAIDGQAPEPVAGAKPKRRAKREAATTA